MDLHGLRQFAATRPKLGTPERFSSPEEFIEICAFEGHTSALVDWQRELIAAQDPDCESLYERIEDTLAFIPTPDSIDALVSLQGCRAAKPELWARSSAGRARRLASILASEHEVSELLRMFEQLDSNAYSLELKGLVLHELILRGIHCGGLPQLKSLLEELKQANHPLSSLPPALTDLELGIDEYLPRYSLSSTSWSRPMHGDFESSEDAGRSAPKAPAIKPSASQSLDSKSLDVFTHWGPGGTAEVMAQRFDFDQPLALEQLQDDLLRGLELTCLEGSEALTTRALEPAQAFGLLFAAASQNPRESASSTGLGPAGTNPGEPGLMGAYGRLATWRTMAVLLGATADDVTVQDLESLIQSTHCFELFAPSPWFLESARCLAMILWPQGAKSLTVLCSREKLDSYG